jgi:hypothetical protein
VSFCFLFLFGFFSFGIVAKDESRTAMAIAYEAFLSSVRTRDIENNMQLIINNILSLIPDGKKKVFTVFFLWVLIDSTYV